jgi:cation diffusion facilitator family transporter
VDDVVEARTHEHCFGQDKVRPGERRTRLVIGITLTMTAVEITAGIAFASMALLADGLHMASHAVALSITVFAYAYARRHARDARYSFGTGKVNALGGFAGAVLLAGFAAFMGAESVGRLVHPQAIAFEGAILVAALGLAVNGLSALLLNGAGERGHTHAHEHAAGSGHDLNLRAAYAHVLADALTSILAIVALLTARYLGLVWMDPVMGLVGAVLVARWSLALLRSTSAVLLDRQAPADLRETIRRHIESDKTSRVADLHVWEIGPGVHAGEITVIAAEPVTPDAYKARIPGDLHVAHLTVEVHCSAAI